jgi:D-serine deaminase-like pyridoxal phosphate-dependent protein
LDEEGKSIAGWQQNRLQNRCDQQKKHRRQHQKTKKLMADGFWVLIARKILFH